MKIYTKDIELSDPMQENGPTIELEVDLIMNVKLKTFKRANYEYDDQENLSSNELIHFKVLLMGEPDMPGNIHIELSSEDDLFFHYKME